MIFPFKISNGICTPKVNGKNLTYNLLFAIPACNTKLSRINGMNSFLSLYTNSLSMAILSSMQFIKPVLSISITFSTFSERTTSL